ncbi:hypothetical protein QCA50_019103 [Cerrena zonata]|uniref:Uncharacterized protein n=1 Tax=Cerrena zonata TaxID=2478898 RepID=A0AAW0FJZ7_9APHY
MHTYHVYFGVMGSKVVPNLGECLTLLRYPPVRCRPMCVYGKGIGGGELGSKLPTTRTTFILRREICVVSFCLCNDRPAAKYVNPPSAVPSL